MAAQFAPTIPSPWPGGAELQLRYWLPHVWTQRGAADARPFAIYWSEGDGIGRLHPQPTDEELRRFYDTSSYDEYMGERCDARDARGDAGQAKHRGFATRMLAHIAWRADRGQPLTAELLHGKIARVPARVCDLGCGAGALLTDLARRGHDVLGVDPNPVAIANGARIGLRVLPGTAEALPDDCPRGAFDLVVMSHSLEHCREPMTAVRNAATLLAANGLLVCDVPNHASAGFRAQGPAWFHTDAGRHLWFFTKHSLRRIAEHAGLHVVGFEFDGFARQFDWLAAEQQVWDALYADPAAAPVAVPPRPSLRSQMRTLWQGLVGGAERRYDAVRLIARKT
jgi:SAM-dependent methyltransferase